MIVSMFLSLPHCALGSFATGKWVNYAGEFWPEILASSYSYGPEKAMKLTKK